MLQVRARFRKQIGYFPRFSGEDRFNRGQKKMFVLFAPLGVSRSFLSALQLRSIWLDLLFACSRQGFSALLPRPPQFYEQMPSIQNNNHTLITFREETEAREICGQILKKHNGGIFLSQSKLILWYDAVFDASVYNTFTFTICGAEARPRIDWCLYNMLCCPGSLSNEGVRIRWSRAIGSSK